MTDLTSDLFAESPRTELAVRVGIGGWVFPAWRKNFYPDGLVQAKELQHASRHLATIEINGTFYRAPAPTTYAKWRNDTPDGFVFSLKAPRYITETKRLAGVAKGVVGFIDGGLAELGDRLGPILWQFAPWRAFDADDIAAFMDLLPQELDGRALRHVLEVRHDSFRCHDYVALARAHGLVTVFTDSPDHPSFADATGDFIYARLMRSRSDIDTGYPPDELDSWAKRCRTWSAGGTPDDLPCVDTDASARTKPRDVFVYFISAAKERNPAAAMALQSQVLTTLSS